MSEIDGAARETLVRRFSATPAPADPDSRLSRARPWLVGDFSGLSGADISRIAGGEVDLLVAGTPCQDFSIAGPRYGLGGERGFLTLKFWELAHELFRDRPGVVVWENVVGVFEGADAPFGHILRASLGADDTFGANRRWPLRGMASGPGVRVAWRVLDSRYFGVPLRRRRVFLVADFGERADPARVLFEGLDRGGPPDEERFRSRPNPRSVSPGDPLAFDLRGRPGGSRFEGPHRTVNLRASTGGSSSSYVATRRGVRRLTPVERERALGFPDGHTFGTRRDRERQIGNTMAVPVIGWVLEGVRLAAKV